jgi:O-antigen/teichoic acid export membrane protein
MSFLAVGTNLGLNQLIPRLMNRWHDQPVKRAEFLGEIIYYKLLLTGLFVTVVGFSVPLIAQFLNYPHTNMIWWAIIGTLGLAMYEHMYLVLSASHKFIGVSLLSILQAVLKSVGFLLVWWLFSGDIFGFTSVYFLSPLLVAFWIGWRWRSLTWSRPQQASPVVKKEIQKYLFHSFLGVLAMTVISNVDLLFVQKSLQSFDAGIYAGASRIALFIGFITTSVGGVLNNRVARYSDRATLTKYLLKSLSLVALSILGFLLYIPLARLSVTYTIGNEYMSGLPVLIILVLNAFMSFAVVPYIAFFYSVDYPHYFSIGGILQVVVIILGNVLFLEEYGISAAAWTRTIATIAFAVYTAGFTWYAWKHLPEIRIANVTKRE